MLGKPPEDEPDNGALQEESGRPEEGEAPERTDPRLLQEEE